MKKIIVIEDEGNIRDEIVILLSTSGYSAETISSFDNTVEDIVNHLNQETNSKYRSKTDSTVKAIHGRMRDGYSVDDIKSTISYMVEKWRGTEFEKYLTPDTLFRPSKFEKYYNEWYRSRAPDDEIDDKYKDYQ